MATISAKCKCGIGASIIGLDDNDVTRYCAGELVQNVWPNLTEDDREVLIGWRTGVYTCPRCWDKMFNGSEV